MYGTIAHVRVKPGNEQALMDLTRAFENADVPGTVAIHVYQMDADPLEYYVAILFSSRESYLANAQSPDQHQRYLEMAALLESEPDWHDGTVRVLVDHRI